MARKKTDEELLAEEAEFSETEDALAETAEQAPKEVKHDETVPGGRYVVNGRLVDCNGKPLNK